MSKTIFTTFAINILAASLLCAQGCVVQQPDWCDEDCCEGFDEELAMDEQCSEYYPGRHCHDYSYDRWRDTAPHDDIGNDWPGKMHDSFFDELSR